MADLKQHGIERVVVLDWETYYDRDYSLSRMTTQNYIMDDQFESILLSAWDSDSGKTFWVPGQDADACVKDLALDRSDTLTVAHHAFFDGGILEWRFATQPHQYLCTMMGARPHMVPFSERNRMGLGVLAKAIGAPPKGEEVVKAIGKRRDDFTRYELAAYGRYGMRDTEITVKLMKRIVDDLPWEELLLIDATVKQFTRPRLRLHAPTLRHYLRELRRRKATLLTDCGVEDPRELRSNPRFAKLLQAAGLAELPMKESPATGEPTFAFAKSDEEFKRLVLNSPNDTVALLGAARVGHKSSLAESRAERFLGLAELNKAVGIPTLYWGAHTGRQSGYDKLNFQNLPRGSELRRAIVAPPGHRIVAGDLSQIEARVLAWLAGESRLVQVFAQGLDPYRDFASRVYSVAYDEVEPEQRRVCKSAILGLGYSMGAEAFSDYLKAQGVKMPLQEVEYLVRKYRSIYPRIPELWNDAAYRWMAALRGIAAPVRYGRALLIAEGFIGLPNGMSIHYPNIRLEGREMVFGLPGNKPRRIYGGKLVENVVQALARIILTRAWLFLHTRGVKSCFSVHDELVYAVPASKVRPMVKVLRHALNREVPWAPGLVVDSEVKVGLNYGRLRSVT